MMTSTQLLFATIAICFVTVSCRSLEDERNVKYALCAEGPHHWCKNFTSATECNAVRYCIQTDWSKGISHSIEDFCSECVTEIRNLKNTISNNSSKEIVKEALEYICEATIFTRIIRKMCAELIDTYVDSHINELLDLLRSDVDPPVICRVLGFCSSADSSVETPLEEDVVVHYDNIVLHFPGHNIQIIQAPETTRKLVGANRCTWGPSYWCGNLTTSKECGSTSHCINSSWSKTQYEEDNDSVCKICKDMVQQARDQLLSNETQEELKEVFEGSCKLIPLKEIRKECIVLADEFVPELTDMLVSQMNPTAVCTVAGLCNSDRIDNLLAAELKRPSTDLATTDSCVNCTVAFTAFERFMQSSTKEDVMRRMFAICSELSSYSDLCASLIVLNFDDMFDMMSTQLQPLMACHLSGMCTYKYHLHPSNEEIDFQQQVDRMLAIKNDDLPCDLCKQLVHHFQEILIVNTTEDEFLQMLHGMCQQTGKFKNECTQLVNENFKIIYKFLTEEINPAKICAEVEICPRSQNYVSDGNLNLISNRMIPILTDEVKLTNLMPISPQQPSLSGESDIECRFCNTIITIVKSELKNPVYENNTEKLLENVCSLVPRAFKARCDEFIDVYADTLIKMLADETDPTVVCAYLKICPQAYTPKSVKNEMCPLCQYLLHYIQQALQDPTDEKQIEEAVKKVCNIVPQAEKSKCDEFISEYAALLISILSQEVDPSLVCPALKLCPSSQTGCAHCRMFMNDLITHLDNDYNLDNIKTKLKSLQPVRGLEKSAVTTQLRSFYQDDLIDMMSAEFDADESCVYMKFCDVNTVTSPVSLDTETNEIADTPFKSSLTTPMCEVCELFVHVYEKELTSNKTEGELEARLKGFCDKMKDADLQSNCFKLVKKYVPIFFDILKRDVSPKELCVAAKLCSLHSLTRNVGAECKTCEIAVGSLESVLGDPITKEHVFKRAVRVCDNMSGKAQTVCVQVITELLPQVEDIAFDIPAWFVCTKMKICPYGDRIDSTVCSNPKLWCQDQKSAFYCDRLNYCAKTVWNLVPSP